MIDHNDPMCVTYVTRQAVSWTNTSANTCVDLIIPQQSHSDLNIWGVYSFVDWEWQSCHCIMDLNINSQLFIEDSGSFCPFLVMSIYSVWTLHCVVQLTLV